MVDTVMLEMPVSGPPARAPIACGRPGRGTGIARGEVELLGQREQGPADDIGMRIMKERRMRGDEAGVDAGCAEIGLGRRRG